MKRSVSGDYAPAHSSDEEDAVEDEMEDLVRWPSSRAGGAEPWLAAVLAWPRRRGARCDMPGDSLPTRPRAAASGQAKDNVAYRVSEEGRFRKLLLTRMQSEAKHRRDSKDVTDECARGAACGPCER